MLLLKEAINSKEPDSAAQSQSVNFQVPHPKKLGAIYALERVQGFGPVKFRLLVEAGITPEDALEDPILFPSPAQQVHESKMESIRCLKQTLFDVPVGPINT